MKIQKRKTDVNENIGILSGSYFKSQTRLNYVYSLKEY